MSTYTDAELQEIMDHFEGMPREEAAMAPRGLLEHVRLWRLHGPIVPTPEEITQAESIARFLVHRRRFAASASSTTAAPLRGTSTDSTEIREHFEAVVKPAVSLKERFKHGARGTLRLLRAASGMTQEQIAERTSIELDVIDKLERAPLALRSVQTLRRIVEACGSRMEVVAVLLNGGRLILCDPEGASVSTSIGSGIDEEAPTLAGQLEEALVVAECLGVATDETASEHALLIQVAAVRILAQDAVIEAAKHLAKLVYGYVSHSNEGWAAYEAFLSKLGKLAALCAQPSSIVTFEDAWAKKRAAGYEYGADALEQVRLGWEMAMAECVKGKS